MGIVGASECDSRTVPDGVRQYLLVALRTISELLRCFGGYPGDTLTRLL